MEEGTQDRRGVHDYSNKNRPELRGFTSPKLGTDYAAYVSVPTSNKPKNLHRLWHTNYSTSLTDVIQVTVAGTSPALAGHSRSVLTMSEATGLTRNA